MVLIYQIYMATITNPFVFYLLFFCSISLFIVGLYCFRIKRLIENTPTSKIRSIAMGFVEIYGKAIPYNKNILKTPFTQQDCVYYRYSIQELRTSGKNNYWHTIKTEQKKQMFLLKDETGQVLINPENAHMNIKKNNLFESSLGKDPPENVKYFLNSNNISYEGFLFGINKTMRYIEHFIAVGDKLYIMGTATDNPYVEEATSDYGIEDVMIQKGNHNKFFFISDKHERGILSLYTKAVYACFIIGLILMSLGLLVIN